LPFADHELQVMIRAQKALSRHDHGDLDARYGPGVVILTGWLRAID